MPIYEYQCDGCGHKLEVIQRMSDNPLSQCPECDNASLRKLVSAAGFRLKGNGWYATDFKDGNKKPAASSKSESSPASTASSGGGATKQPAGPTE